MRTTAHGTSAGVAKLGALWSSVWFNYLHPRPRFWCAPRCHRISFIYIERCAAPQPCMQPRALDQYRPFIAPTESAIPCLAKCSQGEILA